MAETETRTQHFRKLRGDTCNWLVPPNVQAHLTGVQYATQTRSGDIRLTYADGTQESRPCRLDMISEFASFLSVIDYVQAGRE